MKGLTSRVLAGGSVLVFGLLSLTGCEGGAWGVIEELGSDDHSMDSGQDLSPTVEASVVRIIDGDTVAVKPGDGLPATSASGREHSVRVLGIDTPEMDWSNGNHECGAEAAGNQIRSLISEGDTVTLIYDEKADRFDRFDRSLAYVETHDGTDIGMSQAENGFAAAWYPASAPEPTRYPSYASAQSRAEASALGSWGECSKMGR